MACRVGITTDPEGREQYWKQEHPTLRNWKIIAKYASKSAAQAREDTEAEERNCVAHAGGDDPDDANALWHVYYFEY